MRKRTAAMDPDHPREQPRDEGFEDTPLFAAPVPANRSATSKAAADGMSAERVLTQKQRIELFVLERGNATREEIAEGTGLRLASVCGRVNQLVTEGWLQDTGRTRTSSAGQQVAVVEPTPAAWRWYEQREAA